jgi:hypothetical protein
MMIKIAGRGFRPVNAALKPAGLLFVYDESPDDTWYPGTEGEQEDYQD